MTISGLSKLKPEIQNTINMFFFYSYFMNAECTLESNLLKISPWSNINFKKEVIQTYTLWRSIIFSIFIKGFQNIPKYIRNIIYYNIWAKNPSIHMKSWPKLTKLTSTKNSNLIFPPLHWRFLKQVNNYSF